MSRNRAGRFQTAPAPAKVAASARTAGWMVVAALVAAAAVVTALAVFNSADRSVTTATVAPAQGGQQTGTDTQLPTVTPGVPTAPPKPGARGALPPIPSAPAARPAEVVHAVYEFAARHPEVLQYVPCFCGCERSGHVGNDDCFVSSRDASGGVTWDAHGMTWGVCLDVARDAMQMHASGAGATDIRAAVMKRYGPSFPTHTPTPAPPQWPARSAADRPARNAAAAPDT